MNAPDLAALRLLSRRDGALCTLVGIEGSFSRAIGAHLAIGWDGDMAGSLADGCLESELALQARALRGKGPQVMRYGRGSPVIDFRLPCGSGLDVLIDPAPDRAAIRGVLSHLTGRQPSELPLPSAMLPRRLCLPPLRIDLFGHGPEMEAMSRLCLAAGIECRQTPHSRLRLGQRPELSAPDPWTAVVLLFHDHDWEMPILDWALESPAFYIGAIGGARIRQRRTERLALRYPDPQLARLSGPVGLIPATRDPATLALSILAEIMRDFEAARAGKPLAAEATHTAG